MELSSFDIVVELRLFLEQIIMNSNNKVPDSKHDFRYPFSLENIDRNMFLLPSVHCCGKVMSKILN